MNRMSLSGKLIGADALRHTPAGIALVNRRLRHVSDQMEAGVSRRVECEIEVLALADQAMRLSALADGESVRLSGFVANRSRASSHIVLHVNAIDPE